MDIQKTWRLPTGNDVVAIPSLSAASAEIPAINFISRRFRGLVELAGGDEPFLRPLVRIGAKPLDLSRDKSLAVEKIESWVPSFTVRDPKSHELSLRVLAPPGERGFALDFVFKNLASRKATVSLGAQGCWAATRLRINESGDLRLARRAEISTALAARTLVLGAHGLAPEFALALSSPLGLDVQDYGLEGSKARAAAKSGAKAGAAKVPAPLEASWEDGKALRFRAEKSFSVEPGQTLRFPLFFGLGLEAVSAVASAVEMQRQGVEKLWDRSMSFLAQRQRRTGDAELDQILNWNLLFNYFYAMGVTLDSEEFVCLTSRSPHYYVNGAYWDRDSMLWSFPAVLMLDPRRARQMLEYAFFTQGRNAGTHSRFLDGTVLEPGFELDELCAPVIALASYTRHTGDLSLAGDYNLRKVLKQVERVLNWKRHPKVGLYETTSGPSDDFEPLGYLTYDNVMVWRMLTDLAELKDKAGRDQEGRALREQAEKVRAAVWLNLTAEGPRGKMFVWASDLKGGRRFATEPAGCLQLLPYWGFCEAEDQVYRNTVAYLHGREFQYSFAGEKFAEIGSAHSPQPWVLGLCNSLLSGRREAARDLLVKLPMDGRLCCEAFSCKDGRPVSGEAFATAAGFLAWAVWKAYGKA